MKYLDKIHTYINHLINSNELHAFIIQGPPGWSKSTAVEEVLRKLNVKFKAIGSYSTPLNLYNALAKHPARVQILDDCAGLFGDPVAMSILKSATWPSAGTNGGRRVAWGSTSGKALKPTFRYSGKLILMTNSLPNGKETEAFLSRTISMKIESDASSIGERLCEAAKSEKYFPNQKISVKVAEYLVGKLKVLDPSQVNLRTLKIGYDFATANPTAWEELLLPLLPRSDARELVRQLAGSKQMSVKEKELQFVGTTGLSSTSFYNYWRELGFSKKTRK